MKIAIMVPKSDFELVLIKKLKKLGKVVFLKNRDEKSLGYLVDWAKDVEILGADPDAFGGFEKARTDELAKFLDKLPKLKAIALSTSDKSWIDLEYCKKRKIKVINIPNYSSESVAESILGVMLGLAKNIFISDRIEQKGEYKPELGFELKGKTLGVIGLGSIGSRVAELGRVIGMKVMAWNRSPKKQRGIEMKKLDEVLGVSDLISVNLGFSEETKNFLGEKEIEKMKEGVVIVNLADRFLVDEKVMAKKLQSGKVGSYAFEGDDLKLGPLAGIEKAIGFRGFAWYTKDSLKRLNQLWVDNIENMAKDSGD